MTQAVQKDSKEQILAAFNKLLAERKQGESKVATKEQEAESAKNQELLETVAEYTVDNIVNGMASLQLDFGTAIVQLSEKLDNESSKLDELKKAIAVETNHLDRLRKVRLVADTLYILRQEHQEKIRVLEEDTAKQQEAIEKEMAQTRKLWEKEQQEFTARTDEQQELQAKSRESEEGDFGYTTDRHRTIEMDEYEELKRQQERELAESNQDKEKAWAEREKYLEEHNEEFTENEQKIEGFEEELKQSYTKAKEEAIGEAERQAKVKSDLVEKEWEASQRGYELKIQALEASIERQGQQINDLTTQLQAAMNQAQQLAMRAFQSSNGQDN